MDDDDSPYCAEQTWIDGIPVPTATTEFCSANVLRVSAGTNCPRGGDTGHGGRTILLLEDRAGTDLRCGVNGAGPDRAEKVEIVLGGDTECDTLIQALEFTLHTLRLLRMAHETAEGERLNA